MTKEQQAELQKISDKLSEMSDVTDSGGVSKIYAATHLDGHDNVVLSGNREGMMYFASVMLSLAAEAKDQQHYHFDTNSILSKCDKQIIFKFETAPLEMN